MYTQVKMAQVFYCFLIGRPRGNIAKGLVATVAQYCHQYFLVVSMI